MNLTSDKIDLLVPALIKARSQFKAAVKDVSNPYFKSKYVNLDGVIDSINQALLDNSIFCTQPTAIVDGRTVLYTRFLHVSGQWIGGEYPVHPIKNDPQAEGSALTYGRRYALMALAGIAPEDDDGNAASDAAKKADKKESAVPAGKPQDGMRLEDMPEERQRVIREYADVVLEYAEAGQVDQAYNEWTNSPLSKEEASALWFLLPSHHRSAMNRYHRSQKA